MSLHTAAQALWLALPVIAGGVIHVAGLRMGVFPRLARVPLDGGVTLRGRKLFGENKTLRGVVLMTGATMFFAWLQALAAGQVAWARELNLVEFARLHPLAWGALLGLGYIAGELPNSLVKRQLNITPTMLSIWSTSQNTQPIRPGARPPGAMLSCRFTRLLGSSPAI